MFTTDTTNFTVVLPGPCNAKCGFCLSANDPKVVSDYMDRFVESLVLVPQEIQQVSISGGEPTISPMFRKVLPYLANRFKKVVLTTNGDKLGDHLDIVGMCVSHVNISRHSADLARNQEIFNTKKLVSDKEIEGFVESLSIHGVDVSFNCVYDEDDYCMNSAEALALIRNARSLGIASVNFRQNQNAHYSFQKSSLEEALDYHKVLGTGGCPVCFSRSYLILGAPVSFKYTVAEPSNEAGSVFELIMQPNGEVTIDWEGKTSFESILKTEALLDAKPATPDPVWVTAPPSSSCGRSTGRSC